MLLTDTLVNDTDLASKDDEAIIKSFKTFLDDKMFPCVAARAALHKDQINFFVADHMACPKDDAAMLQFLYSFIDEFRKAETQFHSACIIFKGPDSISQEMFDQLLWMRLQALANLDKKNYGYDTRVDKDPESSKFSFSIKEEGCYVVGLSPASSRMARKFLYPALVFNPHVQFEHLRAIHTYDKMKNIVRKRDIEFSGSINPTLEDFGTSSEVRQYSGLPHDKNWKCPLNFS